MRTIRASEIGSYIYCRRAWWYQRQGLPSENREEFASGSQMHFRHGRSVLLASLLRLGAFGLLLLALVFLVIAALQAVLPPG